MICAHCAGTAATTVPLPLCQAHACTFYQGLLAYGVTAARVTRSAGTAQSEALRGEIANLQAWRREFRHTRKRMPRDLRTLSALITPPASAVTIAAA